LHIIENYNARVGRTYCYACECTWDKQLKKYVKPRISIGRLDGEPPVFVPNKTFSQLLVANKIDPSSTDTQDRKVIEAIKTKYGDIACPQHTPVAKPIAKTAWAVFSGPSIVFGGITARYRIDKILKKAFGESDAREILSLTWYLASEGGALHNSDAWLDQYETPAGRSISSQDITRLLDRVSQDGIMTFYKEWLENFKKTGDKILYDLTSISWYGRGINMAGWGHNRDKEALPQVNYALLCARNTAMPLFAWPLDGSISDVSTLRNTLQFLEKLNYKPDCLMMDRGFSSLDNIGFMQRKGYTFLQALRVNANWIYNVIDAGRGARLRPDSMVKAGDRTYYVSTSKCQCVVLERVNKKGATVEEIFMYLCQEQKGEKYLAKDGENILSQHPCKVHVLFCQDLVGGQWDRFMERLNREYERLIANENALPEHELKQYFTVERKKWARQRTVEFNMDNIDKHRDNHAGHICFITNDKTIATAKEALDEYSTRDYIEKDFDELKNELDMRRIRVHTDDRMKARLLIQFIAEIYIREIRVRLRDSEVCRKMTRKQIASHIKGIYKIKFSGKYRSVCPELSKSQRSILEALGLSDSR
jgi:transposase